MISELAQHNTCTPSTSSPHTHCRHPSDSTATSLRYTTTVDQCTNRLTSDEPAQSPTLYYSANRLSTTEDDIDESGVIRQSSSSVFIPRGLSSGPHRFHERLVSTSSSPLEKLLHQLSGESGQEDQAPELEMDLYDIPVC